jgi:hypothetical protein
MPQNTSLPEVIVAINTKPRSVNIPEVRDNTQLTPLTAISALRDYIRRLFISKIKTLEKTLLAAQKLHTGYDYVIR